MPALTPIKDALRTWHTLNAALRGSSEKYAGELFAAEIKGQRRHFILRRIHSRITKLRSLRERTHLAKLANSRTSNNRF